jgi:hypothetical protein
MEPSTILIVVMVVQVVGHAVRQTTTIPKMTFPLDRQSKEQRQEIQQMTLSLERQLKEHN